MRASTTAVTLPSSSTAGCAAMMLGLPLSMLRTTLLMLDTPRSAICTYSRSDRSSQRATGLLEQATMPSGPRIESEAMAGSISTTRSRRSQASGLASMPPASSVTTWSALLTEDSVSMILTHAAVGEVEHVLAHRPELVVPLRADAGHPFGDEQGKAERDKADQAVTQAGSADAAYFAAAGLGTVRYGSRVGGSAASWDRHGHFLSPHRSLAPRTHVCR